MKIWQCPKLYDYSAVRGGGSSGGNLGRVMLVDDSLPFLRNFSSVLQSQGYEVRTADSGLKAVDLAVSFMPDLISLDYDMPGLDGVGTLIKIREKLPEVKVIFISGRMDLEAVTMALASGASECVTKPVNINRLLNIVQALIQSR
ncbi:response regulator [bacterium]|nr:response regulator [bacterium]